MVRVLGVLEEVEGDVRLADEVLQRGRGDVGDGLEGLARNGARGVREGVDGLAVLVARAVVLAERAVEELQPGVDLRRRVALEELQRVGVEVDRRAVQLLGVGEELAGRRRRGARAVGREQQARLGAALVVEDRRAQAVALRDRVEQRRVAGVDVAAVLLHLRQQAARVDDARVLGRHGALAQLDGLLESTLDLVGDLGEVGTSLEHLSRRTGLLVLDRYRIDSSDPLGGGLLVAIGLGDCATTTQRQQKQQRQQQQQRR